MTADALRFTEDSLLLMLKDEGYTNLVKVNGAWCGLRPMIFTHGLFVGLDVFGYSHRYCYHDHLEAAGALTDWIIEGTEEPTGFIKRKG